MRGIPVTSPARTLVDFAALRRSRSNALRCPWNQVLLAAGYRVVHVTWRQLTEEPIRVIAVIAAALTARRGPG